LSFYSIFSRIALPKGRVSHLIIAVSSRFKIDHALNWAFRGGVLLLVVTAFSMGAFFFISSWKGEKGAKVATSSASVKAPSYEGIGKGALALSPSYSSSFSPNLAGEILILAKNSRPDVKSREAYLLVGLKSSRTEKIVLNGQPLFLKCQTKENGACTRFDFSEESTPLWVKPLMLDSGEVLVEVGKKDADLKEEKAQFTLQDSSGTGFQKEEPLYFKSLKEAKSWGSDLLIQRYGGEEYRAIKNKQKIEFPTLSSVCFVQAGDYLVWDEGRWRVTPLEKVGPAAPLAYVKSISGREIELEAWDETGYHRMQTKLMQQAPQRLVVKSENMPTSIRLRTGSQIACSLGKRRALLKEGDWVLKTATGWRILRNVEDIEDFLEHRLKGELLIFDNLEKQEGKVVLNGQLFDEMRTQSTPISLPAAVEKKRERGQRKAKKSLAGGI
jgi:hypothetical protein